MKFPIRAKLILAICLPLLPLYLVGLVVDYRVDETQAVGRMKRHLAELAAHLATEIDEDLAPVLQTTRNTAALMTQSPLQEEEQLDALLSANVRDTPGAYGSAVAFEPRSFRPDRERFARYAYRPAAAGRLVVKDLPYDYFGWDWYLLPKRLHRPAWTEPYFDKGGGEILMCTCAAPFYRREKFQGVATVDISLEAVGEELRKIDTAGGYCLIVSRCGTLVSHPRESLIMADSIFSLAEQYQSQAWADVGREMIAGKTGVQRLDDGESGQPAWIVFAPVASVGWSVATVIPEAEVMADVYAEANRHAAMLVVELAAIVLLIMLVAAWITRPIARLATTAQQLARGNWDVQVPHLHGGDEIGAFAVTFNTMVRDLKANVEQRIQETAARQSLEHELKLARRIQTSLLPAAGPAFPQHGEFSLDACNLPAKIMAGDFYDFWLIDDEVLALVVADVCGKGVPAAMFMAVARTILRSFPAAGQSPGQVLAMANRIIAADNKEQMFVTVFFAHYHLRSGDLAFANAGHNPPYIARGEGAVVSLGEATGPVLGVFGEAQFGDGRTSLAAGDVLVAYTDGVTEATDANGVMFGDERLEQLLASVRGEPVETIRRRILDEVTQYRQDQDQDDVTVLVLKRGESEKP